MSDARPITNVTEYVCGSCWNGFGASDPGVRSTGGTLTCPHCGHMQAAVTDLTAAVRAAPGHPDEAAVADDTDDEVGVGFERPASSPAIAPNPAATAAAKGPAAGASANASGGAEAGAFHHLDLGSDDDGPFDFAAEFASQFGDDQDPGPTHAVDTPASIATAAAEQPQAAIAGEFEFSVDTEEDTPVADFVDPEAAAPAPARPGARKDAFEDTLQAEVPSALASIRHVDTEDTTQDATPIAAALAAPATSKRPSSSMRPALKTAEELLAYLDSTDDDDSMDVMFGSTMSTLEAVDADDPAPVMVRGARAVGEDDDTAEVEAFASDDTTRMRRIDTTTGATAADPSDDTADDEPDFDMVSENTAPDLEATSLEVEPTEWKLRAPPGLTYNFHSVDALLGWASNRSTDGLQVSIDGTVWRPVAPFIDALRAGHRGRRAFALAQVPEMVANMSAEDSRSALDDIRDVDVRDEVIRSLEARANGGVAASAGTSRTRQVRPVALAMDASDLGIDDDTLPASTRAKARVSSTMPAAKAADAPGAGETAATGAGLGPSTRPSGKTPLRATGRTPAVKAGARGDRPATGTQPAVAGGRGPSVTKHTPVVRKDEPKSNVVWLALGVVVLALGAIAGLYAAGIVKLPLP